jgi:tRNA A37 methylthiotransferase MiaB
MRHARTHATKAIAALSFAHNHCASGCLPSKYYPQRVLIDGASWKDASLLAGKTDNGRVVDIAGDVSLIHSFVQINITDVSNPKRLRGEIVY